MPTMAQYKCTMVQKVSMLDPAKPDQTTDDVSQWLPELDRLIQHFDVVKAVITIQTNDGGVADFVVEKKVTPR